MNMYIDANFGDSKIQKLKNFQGFFRLAQHGDMWFTANLFVFLFVFIYKLERFLIWPIQIGLRTKNRTINFIKFYLFMKGNVKNLLFMSIFKSKTFFVLYKNN